MSAPRYAQRLAHLPAAFEVLRTHPDGLRLDDLATAVGVPAAELHEDLLAFYTADVSPMLLGLSRPEVLEFLAGDGSEQEPTVAEVVRAVTEQPSEDIGVEYVDAAELALVYTAATALLEIEPEDTDLAEAVGVLTDTMFGDGVAAEPPPTQPLLDALDAAIEDRRRVRIEYSRAWRAGVVHRVIEPYRLVQTRRGWEVDAGPADERGNLRTWLVSNLRSVEPLEDRFAPPAALGELLERQRATTTVQVRIPHTARWAADFQAERVRVVAEDDDEVTLDLDLLPPVAHRVGLLLLAAGEDARVLDPTSLLTAGPELARDLLAHHRG